MIASLIDTKSRLISTLFSGNACLRVTNGRNGTCTVFWIQRAKPKPDRSETRLPYFCRTLTSDGLDVTKGESYGVYVGTFWEDKLSFAAGRKGLPQEDRRNQDAALVSMLMRGIKAFGDVLSVEQLPEPVGRPPFRAGKSRFSKPEPAPQPSPHSPLPPETTPRLEHCYYCPNLAGAIRGDRWVCAYHGSPEFEDNYSPPTGTEDDFEFELLEEEEPARAPEAPKPKLLNWHDVSCPFCGEAANESCRDPRGNRRRPHRKRVSLVIRTNRLITKEANSNAS